MVSFYDDINEKQLQEYAVKAGFGNSYPFDLKKLEKFFKKGDKILEVGCGTGRLGKYISKKYNYVGIDTHKPYLKVFRRLLNKKTQKYKLRILRSSFKDFTGKNFDIIIFPWSVICDFSKKEQTAALKKASKMLSTGGIVLLDNFAKGSTRNSVKTYTPVAFYYTDWKAIFPKLGFHDNKNIKYRTLTGRIREITILKKS